VLWLERRVGPAPMEFATLVNAVVTDPVLLDRIEALVEDKRHGFESDYGPRIGLIGDFIEREFERLDGEQFALEKKSADVEPLNALFRETMQ
jgi:predicted nucleotidyltransferase